jgi:predicted ester cyclase
MGMDGAERIGRRVEPQFVRDFVTQWSGMVNRKDIAGLLDPCTPDVEFLDSAFPEPFRGKDEVRTLMITIFSAFPDLRYEPVGEPLLSLDQTLAATRVRFKGTMTGPLKPPGFAPTGSGVHFTAVETFKFAGEQVSRIELVFNVMVLGLQIGALPAPRSPGDRLGIRMQHLQAWRMRRSQASK